MKTIHSFLFIYACCSHTRKWRKKDNTHRKSIINNIEGRNIVFAVELKPPKSDKQAYQDEPLHLSIHDRQKYILEMNNNFTKSSWRIGEGNEDLCYWLAAILDQLETMQIPKFHRPSILCSSFSVLTRDPCQSLILNLISMQYLMLSVKKALLNDSDIPTRRIYDKIVLSSFELDAKRTEKADRKCVISFVIFSWTFLHTWLTKFISCTP